MPYGAEASGPRKRVLRAHVLRTPRTTEGVRGSERPVRLPQPMGAGGQQPPKVAERQGPRQGSPL